ncbi:MAG: pre-peptidase C-terminal domain-containing protein [Mastigocoleus sp.]
MPSNSADDLLHNAQKLEIISGVNSFTDSVGLENPNDYYQISIKSSSNLNLKLDSLSNDANIKLLNSNAETVANASSNGMTKKYLSQFLEAGEYYIHVYTENADFIDYNFSVNTIPLNTEDFAGNSIETAKEIGQISGIHRYQDGVGHGDTSDYYKFSISDRAHFKTSLKDLSANANIRLLDSKGFTIATSIHNGINNESISKILDKGDYYIRVYAYGEVFTEYNLSITENAVETLVETPDNQENVSILESPDLEKLGIFSSENVEVLEFTEFSKSGKFDSENIEDIYRFQIQESGIFTANLEKLTGDADIRLIQDINNNDAIDTGEILAWETERGNVNESIRSFLEIGTYYLQVFSYNNQLADYSVNTSFSAADKDNRSFSIQVNFTEGSEFLTESMKNAVIEATEVWENVITHSTLKGAHILKIDVGGTEQGWSDNSGILASAGPNNVSEDESGNWLPVAGSANINTNINAIQSLSSDIDYFRNIMTHEFGHILGLGSLWGELNNVNGDSVGRNLVDKNSGTYNANTYAGSVYGEMLNTFIPTAIPLTTGVDSTSISGSDLTHWNEEVFHTEIMTHAANKEEMPLSQLTIAALRDLGWNVNYGAAEDYYL